MSPSPQVQPFAIIQKYYAPNSALYHILAVHSMLVANRALEIARAYQARNAETQLDFKFIEEAALLHDIGIYQCDAPSIYCFGKEPYIKHGIIGREILEKEGLPRHALVCERHTGAGLTREDVIAQKLPLPLRDYVPLSLEEKIICLADRFYVKKPATLYEPLTVESITTKMSVYGEAALARWQVLQRILAE